MKWASLTLAVLLVVTLVVAVQQGRLEAGFRSAYQSGLHMLPVLALAILLMGFLDALVPQDWVARWLSDASGWRGLGIAWLAGALTPGGSVIGMPVAGGLLSTGASPAVVITYLTSMATMNVLRVPLEVGFYGFRLMLLRLLACAVVPFVAGGVARLISPLILGR